MTPGPVIKSTRPWLTVLEVEEVEKEGVEEETP